MIIASRCRTTKSAASAEFHPDLRRHWARLFLLLYFGDEANLPAPRTPTEEDPRVPGSYAHPRRTEDPCQETGQGPLAARHLGFARAATSSESPEPASAFLQVE